jgi:hypothetical protein
VRKRKISREKIFQSLIYFSLTSIYHLEIAVAGFGQRSSRNTKAELLVKPCADGMLLRSAEREKGERQRKRETATESERKRESKRKL